MASTWQAVFGEGQQVPLWTAHTPGGLCALSPAAIMRPHGEESARRFYERVLLNAGLEPPPKPPDADQDPGAAQNASPKAVRSNRSQRAPRGAAAAVQDAGVPEVEAAGVEPADDLIAAHALERMYRPIFVPLEGQAEPPPRMRDMIERQYVLHKSLKMS